MNDVFICYSDEDEGIASDVCNLLESNKYNCWFKKRDYGENDSVVKITEAIRDSRGLLLIYSKDAKKSNFVATEVDIAFSSNVPILVFSVDDSEYAEALQFYLKDKPKIDAYPNAKEHYDKLLKDTDDYLGADDTGDVSQSEEIEAYICYADEDVLTAEAIAHVLEENGIKCWFKNRDLKVNETVQKVAETIKNSKSFILVYSDDASKSNFVKTDTDLALSSNIPILSFKIEDVDKSDKLSGAHWLDAYPNPENNFKDLVKDTGKLIGKGIDSPKVTKNYKDLKKVEKVEKKPVAVKDDSSKEFSRNYGIGKKFAIIAVVVIVIAIVAGVAYYMITTTSDVNSELNIPAGFEESNDRFVQNTSDTEYKFYKNDKGDYFDVMIITSDEGRLTLGDQPGFSSKTINGVPGKISSDKLEFHYLNSKGDLVMVTASNEKLIEEVIK